MAIPPSHLSRTRSSIDRYTVSAEQMQAIEQRLFDAGMPVAALMEKVASKLTVWLQEQLDRHPTRKDIWQIGILAGPGHNGGDALVMARELFHRGYRIQVYQPFNRRKDLTDHHRRYAQKLGIPFASDVQSLANCDAIVDGWFGFGLERAIEGNLADDIHFLNQQDVPIYSIDLPSGIHTDSGNVLGTALHATATACLGLWKWAFLHERAIAHLGTSTLIDFDIPIVDITAVLGEQPATERITPTLAHSCLPLDRAPTAHKYTAGHLLLIAGSQRYAGAALLAGTGAIASGVGMLTLAVPESLRMMLVGQLPSALVVGCAETKDGAIAHLPSALELNKYDAIAFGPGLTTSSPALLDSVLAADSPLLLDADGLNLLSKKNVVNVLQSRPAPTVLTPHLGEFRRLFPEIAERCTDTNEPGAMAQSAAATSRARILLKGARSAIAHKERCWINPHSTPALARGGSGDVLTGLMGGLIAITQKQPSQLKIDAIARSMISAVWWHSQTAIQLSQQRKVLGVDPLTLAQSLNEKLA